MGWLEIAWTMIRSKIRRIPLVVSKFSRPKRTPTAKRTDLLGRSIIVETKATTALLIVKRYSCSCVLNKVCRVLARVRIAEQFSPALPCNYHKTSFILLYHAGRNCRRFFSTAWYTYVK